MLKNLLVSAVLAFSFSANTPVYANSDGVKNGKPDILEVLELRSEVTERTAIYFKEQVEKINENTKIKGVLLIVETPGGGAIATSNAYEELSKLKVPVVAWCTTVCASGGMYIMMAPSVKFSATRNEAIVGSIGVVATQTRFNRLLDYLKIDNETFKSGSLKDSGNPTRAATEEDRKYIQSIINSLAAGFYEAVDKSRGSKIKDWDQIKSAKIFIGKEAVAVGLVDAVMDYDSAVVKAKELSKSKNIYTRDELKKIAKEASGDSDGYRGAGSLPKVTSQFGDVAAMVEIIKEVREGQSTRFEFRMPYRF